MSGPGSADLNLFMREHPAERARYVDVFGEPVDMVERAELRRQRRLSWEALNRSVASSRLADGIVLMEDYDLGTFSEEDLEGMRLAGSPPWMIERAENTLVEDDAGRLARMSDSQYFVRVRIVAAAGVAVLWGFVALAVWFTS